MPSLLRPRAIAAVAVLLAAAVLGSCRRADPAEGLAARYPRVASRILGGPGFSHTERGFVPAETKGGESDPVTAPAARG